MLTSQQKQCKHKWRLDDKIPRYCLKCDVSYTLYQYHWEGFNEGIDEAKSSIEPILAMKLPVTAGTEILTIDEWIELTECWKTRAQNIKSALIAMKKETKT